MEPNPINDERWERLSTLGKSMVLYILHSDEAWLKSFVEGEIRFQIGGRRVQAMVPAPTLREKHDLPPIST